MNALLHRVIAPMSLGAFERMTDQRDAKEAAIEIRAEALKVQYRADLEIISDKTADVLSYRTKFRNHPKALAILELIQGGTDDAELGRLIRTETIALVDADAQEKAEDEAEDDL